MNDEVAQEKEAIDAIYGADAVWSGDSEVRVKLAGHRASLRIRLPPNYPSEAATALYIADEETRVTLATAATLGPILSSAASSCVGRAAIFDIVSAAMEWLDSRRYAADSAAAVAAAASTDAALVAAPPPRKWWETEDDDDDGTNGEATAAMIKEATARAAAEHTSLAAQQQQTGETYSSKKKRGNLVTSAEWKYTIGLIGKPSSGKSTFFNASCGLLRGLPEAAVWQQSIAARMAAHPFTTIAPNFGRGFAAVPCPCNGDTRCKAPYGHCDIDGTVSRLIPVSLKDVAGLVPGAYRGRGKGNRFLDDLNDADVLIHIIDVSGETDSEGRAVGHYGDEGDAGAGEGSDGDDPMNDVGWIRNELHRWIFGNVRAKWASVRRRPEKLPTLFSGYRAGKSLVRAALSMARVDPATMCMAFPEPDGTVKYVPPMDWGPMELHFVVASFLRTRFPILLCLNKADSPAAVSKGNVAKVKAAWPTEKCVPVSARGELLLQHLRSLKAVDYQQGSASFTGTGGSAAMKNDSAGIPSQMLMEAAFSAGFRATDDENKPLSSSDDVGEEIDCLQRNVMGPFGSTGVLKALSVAMSMRPPVAAFPVAELGSFMPLVSFDDSQVPLPRGPLRDCVLLRPGSTVGDLCETLKHEPFHLLAGDYVLAESCPMSLPSSSSTPQQLKRVLHKEDRITKENSILCITTTRRAV